ncbi:MAG: tellurium resistance protein [Geodermatophilaceae bacterium]|nr:tellurium resistance protein [Geodermatophilaceae bacterium]
MGIDYNKRPQTPAQPPAQPTPPPAYGAPPPQQQQGGNVSLSKLTLTKSAPSVSLSKTGGGGGVLRVNLNWNARPEGQPAGGFFKRLAAGASSGAIDLDLGCLYEYSDGSKGVVQALGNAFRGQHQLGAGESIIWLDADDRSGTNTGGENLHVDLRHIASIRRIIVFALIYEGVPNWAAADAVVTMFPVSGPQIEVRLDEPDPKARICAVALLENRGGEMLVNREVRYVNGGQDVLDKQYGWGMNWSPGRK